MTNLLTGSKDKKAVYNEGPDTFDIDGVAFVIDYYSNDDFRLKPLMNAPEGHTPYMGDGFKATIIGGFYNGYSGITVLSRAETWAEYEVYSR